MSKTNQGERPAGMPAHAMYPPRVSPAVGVTTTDASVEVRQPVPEGGYGVRLGVVPAVPQPRADRTTDLPTEGPGAARRAIPAPEEAGTTGTIPPPTPTTLAPVPTPTASSAHPLPHKVATPPKASPAAGRKGKR